MTGEFQKSDTRNSVVHISSPISTNHQVSLTKKIKNIALTNNTKINLMRPHHFASTMHHLVMHALQSLNQLKVLLMAIHWIPFIIKQTNEEINIKKKNKKTKKQSDFSIQSYVISLGIILNTNKRLMSLYPSANICASKSSCQPTGGSSNHEL